MIYALCLVLIAVGFYGVAVSRNVLKIVLAMVVVEHGVNLLLLLVGYRAGGAPPAR